MSQVMVATRLEKHTADQLDHLSGSLGLSRAELARQALELGIRSYLIEFAGIAPGDLPSVNEIEGGQIFEYASRYAAARSNTLANDLLVVLPDDPNLPEADRGRLALAPRGRGGETTAVFTEAAQRAGIGDVQMTRWSLPKHVYRGPIAGVFVEPVRPATLSEPVGRTEL